MQDTTSSSTENNPILCSFTLRELVKHLNLFREEEHLSSLSQLSDTEEILKGGHIDIVTSLTVPLVSVHTLGAVQNISFLDRNALRHVLAPGLVDSGGSNDDDENNRERLLIGFRRCMVVLSIENSINNLHIEAYIGPANVDEYENDIKIQKRQPSSFAIPISENCVAYGCYDGGIRFYDIQKRQQVKACLGPNGRTNPIVKMINANPISSQSKQPPVRPRIISACVSANAYLWELDLSIDLTTGEIYHFDIPPPKACFDGMVAAVSSSAVPVTYPPPLSPTTRATLSPCSSWDQTDLLQEQFRLSYDAHKDRLCFAFSPDAIGTSLNPYATRQERLELNGALVFWNLTDLPTGTWPLPPIAPLCVTSLPRTKDGRVASDFVLPGYICSDGVPSSFLVTLYVTSANEAMAAVTILDDEADCVQKCVTAVVLSNMSAVEIGGEKSNFVCHSLAISSSDPTVIALGTQKGALLVRIMEDLNIQLPSITTSSLSGSSGVPTKKSAFIDESYRIDDSTSSVRVPIKGSLELDQSDVSNELRKDNMNCFSYSDREVELNIPYEDEEQSSHDSSSTDFGTPPDIDSLDITDLRVELRRSFKRLELQKTANKDLSKKLATAEKKAEANYRSSGGHSSSNMFSIKEPRAVLEHSDEPAKDDNRILKRRLSDAISLVESEVTSKNDEDDDVSELTGDYVQAMQEENADLRRQVHELIANKDDVSDISNDGDMYQRVEREKLHQQLSIAKETEQSLRDYIELLEQNKDAVEDELEFARQDAEKSALMVENLQSDIYEQKLAMTEMANLLEEKGEQRDPEAEHTLVDENAHLKQKVALQVARTTAMKIELQNALNELAEVRQKE